LQDLLRVTGSRRDNIGTFATGGFVDTVMRDMAACIRRI
jgi:hypothetical protein